MARTYALTNKAPEKPLSGQALAIYDGMKKASEDAGEYVALDGKAWTEKLKDSFKTRQDAYRVVLYYLLIFKKRGLVEVREVEPPVAETEPETEHAEATE